MLVPSSRKHRQLALAGTALIVFVGAELGGDLLLSLAGRPVVATVTRVDWTREYDKRGHYTGQWLGYYLDDPAGQPLAGPIRARSGPPLPVGAQFTVVVPPFEDRDVVYPDQTGPSAGSVGFAAVAVLITVWMAVRGPAKFRIGRHRERTKSCWRKLYPPPADDAPDSCANTSPATAAPADGHRPPCRFGGGPIVWWVSGRYGTGHGSGGSPCAR